jgi:hypothetical protein
MNILIKILPVYGEGNREAVEGVSKLLTIRNVVKAPSVSATHCHLPANGEDL